MECKFMRVFFVLCFFSFTNAIDLVLEEECLNYTVYPLQYEINIYPFVKADQSYYDCDLTITIIANAPGVFAIELDAKDLEIDRVHVYDGPRDITHGGVPYEYNMVRGKLVIYVSEELKMYRDTESKIYSINILFRRKVRPDGEGVFLVKYYDEQSKDYK